MTTRPEVVTTRSPRAARGWRLAGALAVTAATLAVPAAANAQTGNDGANYVTTTTSASRSIDVSGSKPVCMKDVPHVQYLVVPIGFTPSTISGTLRLRDVNGNVLISQPLTSLSGVMMFPGAAADGSGNGTQWPGWVKAPDGSCKHDPTNDILKGLTIEVTLYPGGGGAALGDDGALTASARVSYPADSECAGPQGITRPGSGSSGGSLPNTGSSIAAPLAIGGISIAAGIVALATARRRSSATA